MSRRRSTPTRLAQGIGIAGGVTALAAGAAAGGLELERRRLLRRFGRLPELTDVPFFTLRGPGPEVVTPDGVRLHTEVDEFAAYAPEGAVDPGVTVVLVHGYVLSLHCWHFQRAHLRGRHRIVLYDQRSHGRSGRAPADSCRVTQLAKDLVQVLEETTAPDEPVVLVGHSMGGMTIQQLAIDRPDLFGTKVVGVGLVATTSGDLRDHSIVPGIPGTLFSKVAPPLLAAMNRVPVVVERSRRATMDLGFVATRRMSYGSDVPPAYVDFMARMVAETPMQVVADFYPAFALFDGREAFGTLARVETAVVGGEDDQILPVEHTERIIELLPGADTLVVQRGGHMVMIEHHARVDEVLDDLLERAARTLA